jgi:hypothetical protein
LGSEKNKIEISISAIPDRNGTEIASLLLASDVESLRTFLPIFLPH